MKEFLDLAMILQREQPARFALKLGQGTVSHRLNGRVIQKNLRPMVVPSGLSGFRKIANQKLKISQNLIQLALFEKLKARGGFDGEDRRELVKVERMLRTFAATEKADGTGGAR